MVSAIQAGAVGTQACNEAIATISGIVGDLETTAMFCTAGALNPDAGAITAKYVTNHSLRRVGEGLPLWAFFMLNTVDFQCI